MQRARRNFFLPAARPWLAMVTLWITLVALILIANRDPLLTTPVHETGDFAVNALQIDHAKRFAEIYGNYSRFHFHHPGPAFFYVYAAGERVLVDGLAWVPSPFNAHVILGIGLQAGFFSLGLFLLASCLDRRRTIVVGLVVAAVHFGFVPHAFTGIWPPEVLLMPFFAFFAGCVALSLGRVRVLPAVVLAGSFLVHGHVAQPLFVGTLFLVAYYFALRRQGGRWRQVPELVRSHRAPHALALAVLAVFLFPLALDLLQGGANFRRILLHLHGNGGGGKGPLQSALYFLTFTTRTPAPETLLETVGLHSFGFITARPWLFLGWLASVLLFGWGSRSAPADEGLRRLWQLWLLTLGLCLVWGLLQAGPMFAFNGFFYHAVNYVAYVGAATVVVRRWPRRGGWWIGAPAAVAAAAGLYLWVRIPPDRIDHGGRVLHASTERALALDPHPTRPKLLVFPHSYWSHAVSVALALHRSGVPFRVEPELEFMFEERFTAARSELTDPDIPFSVWRFTDPAKSATGPIIPHGRGIAFEPDSLSPENGTIPFGAEDGFIGYHLAGISGGENGRSWTKDQDVVLQFRPEHARHDVQLTLEARPYAHPRVQRGQRVELRMNDQLLWSGTLEQEGTIVARIPQAVWNARPVAHLWLHLPDALAPVVLGSSGDWRVLGLEMTRLTTQLAPAPTP